MTDRRAEATAPCSLLLAAGVGVALDRRAWARVEMGGDGLEVHSRDTVRKVRAGSVAELAEEGHVPEAVWGLQAAGLEGGARVETQSRVPVGSGLGEASALALVVAAAALRARGEAVDPATLIGRLAEGRGRTTTLELALALKGGTAAGSLESEGEVQTLEVDPARMEECLLLVDGGDARPGAREDAARGSSAGRETRQALLEGRFGDVGAILAAEWEARKGRSPAVTTAGVERVVALARAAGGAGWACGPGPGSLVAIWAPPGARGPGAREGVEKALAEAGLKAFAARVDLLGLELV